MLDEKDIKAIKSLMNESLTEFYETIILPYFNEEHKWNKEEHKETREVVKEQVREIGEYVKDHEKRITKLEVITGAR